MRIEPRLLSEKEFPPQLREIPQPPKQLYVAGETFSLADTVLLTVVGARKHSSYGREVCEMLISGLAGHDITIVSGLAIGIDSIAHESALSAGLRTIAVPGSGLDESVLYPRSNVNLAHRILDSGGNLLSEYPPLTKSALWTFPERNRIMAGLSQATLLIEAQEKSGTLITARLATDYNRDVLAVPGDIFSPLSAGPNRLISLGATPIHSPQDILLTLGFSEEESDTQLEIDFSKLEDTERRVMEALTSPKGRDVLIEELGLSVSAGNILLMKMEIAGLIKDAPNGIRRI